jgi:hypothetical protein
MRDHPHNPRHEPREAREQAPAAALHNYGDR